MQNNLYNDEKTKTDRRNLIIFMITVFILFAGYDIFIKKPYVDKVRDQQRQELAVQPKVTEETNVSTILPRADALKTNARIQIMSETITGSISLKGARIDDLTLNNYYKHVDHKDHVELLSPSGTPLSHYGQFGWVGAQSGITLPNQNTLWQVSGNQTLTPQKPVTLFWNNGQGLRFEQKISLDEQYMFAVEQTVINNSGQSVKLHNFGLVSQSGEAERTRKTYILHEGPIGYINKELDEIKYKDLNKKRKIEYVGSNGWIGFTQKYWFTGLISQEEGTSKYRFLAQPVKDHMLYQTDIMGPEVTVQANGDRAQSTTYFFAGPKKVRMLDAYEKSLNIPHFDLVVDFGMFYFLTKPFFYVLTWISHQVGSFAIGLILFTVLLRLLVFPLAQKSYRSFAKMRQVSPKLKEIQEKHKDDREALQKAMLELYKKEDVNPAAGCLPMLVQIPIFFALYKVLYITIEMRQTPFFGWILDMSEPDPTSVFNLFGLIPWDPPSFLMIGAWPCIMFCTLFLQQRLSPPPTDAMQKQIMGMMPFVMTFILSKFPAGLVIYWTWSNTLSIIQQSVLMKSMGVKIHLFSFLEKDNGEEDEPIKEEATPAEAVKKPSKPEKPTTAPKRRRKKK